MNLRGIMILRAFWRGQYHSLSMDLTIKDLVELPITTGWVFQEMDRRLYERIGHIPQDREWEVVARG